MASDDFSRWWQAFQSGSPRGFAEAAARWRSRQSKAWLYVALSLARGDAAEAEELIGAALAVPMEHAGGPALHFQAARLMGERREFERAGAEADGVIGAIEDLPSARNRALSLRAQLAATPAEFARLAPKRVIQHGMELDTREFEGHTYDGELAGLDRLDLAMARVFSEKMPRDALAGLARDPASLPEHLHAELRLAAWTRAVLLHRWDVAREFVPAVSPERDRFLEAPSETTGAYLLLKLPGARPYMSVGYGRATPVDKHDEWVRNWWYRFTEEEMYRIDWQMNNEGSAPVLTRPAFLSEDENRQAQAEWHAMQSEERGLNWLALRIANDLRAHGERRDAPQVLYRVLEASNRGWWAWPPDGELPQPGLLAAWRLLSTRYPRSVWVQRARELQGAYVDQLK